MVIPNTPSASEYGRSLKGMGVNLIVRNLAQSITFASQVLGAKVSFSTPNFAAMTFEGSDFMFHVDETYKTNPLFGSLQGGEARGIGVELRCFGCNPDLAEAKARESGYTVLAGALDKPHGLREAMILDDDGFVWIPSIHLKQ
jgi:catechol 2,3-dioxygenase-like lactoylglutathione lyase family enzyme